MAFSPRWPEVFTHGRCWYPSSNISMVQWKNGCISNSRFATLKKIKTFSTEPSNHGRKSKDVYTDPTRRHGQLRWKNDVLPPYLLIFLLVAKTITEHLQKQKQLPECESFSTHRIRVWYIYIPAPPIDPQNVWKIKKSYEFSTHVEILMFTFKNPDSRENWVIDEFELNDLLRLVNLVDCFLKDNNYNI